MYLYQFFPAEQLSSAEENDTYTCIYPFTGVYRRCFSSQIYL